MTDRGQGAIGTARFFLALIVGAVLFWILSAVTTPVLDRAANATSNATANQATGWHESFIGMVPVIVLLAAFISVIVAAVYYREVLR